MNESFAIQGYSASSQMLCVIENDGIYQYDFSGTKKLIGKTIQAYTELEETTTEYYNKLVELGVIVPPKSPEDMIREMQQTMLSMSSIIQSLSEEVKELKKNGSECNSVGSGKDVPIHKPQRSSAEGTASAAGDA